MKRIGIIVIILAVLIIGYTLYKRMSNNNVYKKYLLSVGIPAATIDKMSNAELKAAFKYLKQYAKDNIHFAVDNPDYDILSAMRIKYGIFS